MLLSKALANNADKPDVDPVCHLYRVLGDSLDLEETLSAFDCTLRPLIPYVGLSLHLAEGERLLPAYAAGREFAALGAFDVPLAQGPLRLAASTRRPILNCGAEIAGLAAALVIPLEHGGTVTSVLALYQDGSRRFTDSDLRLLGAVAPKLARVIENARTYRSIAKLAGVDPATGLLNARSLFERLDAEMARARRRNDGLCVAHCGLEGLSEAPPELAARVRRRVAAGLREGCREYDAVACLGADFVLVLAGFARADLEEKLGCLRQTVEAIGLAAGLPLALRTGAAFFPGDAAETDGLLAGAAERLQQARRTAGLIANDCHHQ